jgi:hypothetical protein
MDKKQLVELLNRIVNKRVEAEVDRRVNQMRMQIMSEVAGMLSYTERKILAEIQQTPTPTPTNVRGMEEQAASSDFDRSMRNLRSMPNYQRIVEKVAQPQRRLTSNPTLNELLNDTDPLSRDEAGIGPRVVGGESFGDVDVPGSYSNPATITSMTPSEPVLGTDNRPINFANPTVQKVLDILNNTNHKEKFEAIKEVGDNARDNGMMPLVTATDLKNNYFDKSIVG